MGLFSDLSAEQRTILQIRDSAFGARALMLAAVNNCEALVWANPYGLTPQQVFDLLGAAGPELLAIKSAVLPIFATSGGDQPKQLKPEGVGLTIADGKVLVSDK